MYLAPIACWTSKFHSRYFGFLSCGSMVLKFGGLNPKGTAACNCARVAPLANPFWKAAFEFATDAKMLFGLFRATRPELVVKLATAGVFTMKRSAIRPW